MLTGRARPSEMETWLTSLFTSDAGLATVFCAGFLAATVLPGGSEVFLFGLLALHPQLFWPAILVATAGNTLGGLTSYALGRFLPQGKSLPSRAQHWMGRVRYYGSPLMLLAWTPWIGDALCVAAGWLRIHALWSTIYMTIGKFARFWVTGQAAVQAMDWWPF